MKNDAGLTLIEVLVAMAILFVIFLGITNAGLVVLDQNIKNSQRDEAVQVADNVVQWHRDQPFTNIVAGTTYDNVSRQIRGMNQRFSITKTVTSLDPVNRQVVVNVAWTRIEYGKPRQYNHSITTIVRQR